MLPIHDLHQTQHHLEPENNKQITKVWCIQGQNLHSGKQEKNFLGVQKPRRWRPPEAVSSKKASFNRRRRRVRCGYSDLMMNLCNSQMILLWPHCHCHCHRRPCFFRHGSSNCNWKLHNSGDPQFFKIQTLFSPVFQMNCSNKLKYSVSS